jgi:hypothetical protein
MSQMQTKSRAEVVDLGAACAEIYSVTFSRFAWL